MSPISSTVWLPSTEKDFPSASTTSVSLLLWNQKIIVGQSCIFFALLASVFPATKYESIVDSRIADVAKESQHVSTDYRCLLGLHGQIVIPYVGGRLNDPGLRA